MKMMLQGMMAAGLMLALTGASWAGGVATGDPAPGFTLTDANGKEHSLADFKGKHVVLEWINFGCPFVRKHYDSDNMQGLQKRYTGKGVIWLSICSSAPGKGGHMSPGKAVETIGKKGTAATAYLMDEDGTVGMSYGARCTPHMFVIDADGRVAYQGAIDSIKSPRRDDIPQAENYVASALDALLAGKTPATATTKPYGCGIKYR